MSIPSPPRCGGEGQGEGGLDCVLYLPPPHPSPLPRFAGAREIATTQNKMSLAPSSLLAKQGRNRCYEPDVIRKSGTIPLLDVLEPVSNHGSCTQLHKAIRFRRLGAVPRRSHMQACPAKEV